MQNNQMKIGILGTLFVLLMGCSSTHTMGPLFSPNPTGVTLNQSVEGALMGTGDPVLGKIHVESNQHEVVLSGYVKKIRQSDVAEQIAGQVPGVQTVVNHLIVRQ
ncbi:MAG: BON domain-containing protein [Legionella sp.]|nr:MAG: BON domain-containing protein [Legionella sp.]